MLGDDRYRLAWNPAEFLLYEMQRGQQLAVGTWQRLDQTGDALDGRCSLGLRPDGFREAPRLV